MRVTYDEVAREYDHPGKFLQSLFCFLIHYWDMIRLKGVSTLSWKFGIGRGHRLTLRIILNVPALFSHWYWLVSSVFLIIIYGWYTSLSCVPVDSQARALTYGIPIKSQDRHDLMRDVCVWICFSHFVTGQNLPGALSRFSRIMCWKIRFSLFPARKSQCSLRNPP